MKASAFVSHVLARASQVLETARNEGKADLTPPDGLSNEKTVRWFEKQEALNNYLITSLLASYFDKEKDAAKKRLEAHGLLAKYESVAPGERAELFAGQLGTLVLRVNQPRSMLNKTDLMSRLTLKLGMSTDEATQFVEDCSRVTAPPRSLEVVTNVE